MAKKDLVRVIDNSKKVQNGTSFFTAGSSGGTIDTTNFLLLDGTRAMLASLDMGGFSITNVNLLDGYDLTAHITNPNAHHDAVTAGTLISLSGQQVSVASGTAQYQIPVTGPSTYTPSWTLLSTFAGNGLLFSAGQFAVNPGDGIAIVTSAVKVKTPTNSGLVVDATGVYVGAGNGLQISGASTSVKLATDSGLAFNAGGLEVNDTIAGIGLAMSTDKKLSVNAGVGLTTSGDNVILGTPSTIDTGTVSGTSGTTHTHTLTWSPSPAQTSRILGTDGSGELTLYNLKVTNRLQTSLINTTTGTNLVLQPTQRLTFSPDGNIVQITTGVTFQSDNFASQTQGFGISYIGSADFRYVFTDELHAKSFIADLEQALAGGQIICKSVAVLAADFVPVGAGVETTITVRDLPSATGMAVFQAGDIIRIRSFTRSGGGLSIADCWGVVSGTPSFNSTNKTQTWTFTRSSAPNAGTMGGGAGNTVKADAIILDYGTSGNGFYEVNAVDGAYGLNSPYMQIVSWTTHPHTGRVLRMRAGNLKGIFSGSDEYGLYIGGGTAIAADGTVTTPVLLSQYIRVSNLAVEFHNIPTKWYKNFAIVGDTQTVDISSDGTMWMGKSSADKRFEFDGTNVKVKGSLLVGPGTGFATSAILYAPFGGSSIRGDYTGSYNGHKGQLGTPVGQPRFRPGKFGKALECSPAITNLVINPSFELDSVGTDASAVLPADWVNTYYGNGGISANFIRTVTDEESWDGFRSLKIKKLADTTPGNPDDRGGSYFDLTVDTSKTYVVSARMKLTNVSGPIATASLCRLYANALGGNVVSATNLVQNEWVEMKLKIVPNTTTLRISVWIENCLSGNLYVDAVQVIEYASAVTAKQYNPFYGEGATPSVRATRAASYLRHDGIAIPWTNFSISLWANLEETVTGGSTRLFELRSVAAETTNRINLTVDATGYVDFFQAGELIATIGTNGSESANGTILLAPDVWNHLALTVKDGVATVYVNGAVSSTKTLLTVPRSKTADIWYGYVSGNPSQTLNGYIDDFALIDRGLTADEVAQIAVGNAPLQALFSANEMRVGGLQTDGSWGEVAAYDGGLFGSTRDNAGAYTRHFSLLTSNITGTWAGITNPNAGDVIIGDASVGTGNYLRWDSANSALVIKGSAMIKGASPVVKSGAGLYLGSDKIGYYNGTSWKTWIKSDGRFFFGGTTDVNDNVTGARLEWNGSKLSGYSASAEQWYADASDGKIKFAAGKGILDASGITLNVASSWTDEGFIAWYDTALSRADFQGSISVGQLNSGSYNIGMRLKIGRTFDTIWDIYAADTTGALHRMWHAGNDGAGSGLDAGYLGGYVYSEYPRLNVANTGTLQVDGLILAGAKFLELAGSGGNDRVWRPGQQIAATNQGTYGPTLTYLATYNGGWKGIAGGNPAALGVTEGLLWFATGGTVTTGGAITWTNRLTLTATTMTVTANLSVTGTITATSTVSGVNFSASGTLGVTGATTLSSTLGVTGRATLSDYLEVTKGVYITEVASTPPDPTNNAQLLMYVIGNKLVLAFKQSGTMRYFTIDLQATGTPAIVNNGTTAPS